MVIIALNTKKKHIANLPVETTTEIPNKDDILLYKNVEYKVLYRYFQYNENELDIVDIMVKEALSIHSVMQSDYTPDMIAKHLKWDSYDHMKINEEHIEPQFKEAINMIFWLCKLEVPFYSA